MESLLAPNVKIPKVLNSYASHYALKAYGEEESQICFGEPCYGDIAEYQIGEALEGLVVFHPDIATCNVEVFDWVMSDRVFGEAFLSKDLEVGCNRGFVLNVEKPYEYLLGAMIALRACFSPKNYDKNGRLWGVLSKVEATIEEKIWVATALYEDGGYLYVTNYCGDHFPFNPMVTGFKAFCGASPTANSTVPSNVEVYLEEEAVYDLWPLSKTYEYRDLFVKTGVTISWYGDQTPVHITKGILETVLKAGRAGELG